MDLTHILLDRFGLANVKVEAITSGEENRNYKVFAPSTQFVLRVYSPAHSTTGPRTQDQIEQELRFIEHLAAHKTPTPTPIKNQAGERVSVGSEEHFLALFDYADGRHPAEYSPEIAAQIGRLLRTIREASKQFNEPATRTWEGDTAEDYLAAYRSISDKFSADQRLILDELADQVALFLAQSPPLDCGFIHGDVKLGNLLFSADGKLTAVIDFDDFREAFYLEELARTLMHDLHDPNQNAIRAGAMPHMLAGYAPDQHELACLKPFLQARFLYDAGSYIFNGLSKLVDELLQDEQLIKAILT